MARATTPPTRRSVLAGGFISSEFKVCVNKLLARCCDGRGRELVAEARSGFNWFQLDMLAQKTVLFASRNPTGCTGFAVKRKTNKKTNSFKRFYTYC